MAEAAVEGRPLPVRFFCHKCNIEFEHLSQDYTCPFCAGGFIEQLDTSDLAQSPTNQNHPVIDDAEIEMALDETEDLSHENRRGGDRWANWQPPWNYRSANTSPRELSFNAELPMLLSGNHIRGVRGTMSFGGPESFLQQVMWQLTGGGAGGPPVVLVTDPADYVVSGEGLDAVMSQLLWQAEADGPPPLQQDAIAQLPEISVTEDQVQAKLQCSVCWELFNKDEKVRQLSCGHMYHQACIAPWLALHATCPICRQSLAQPGAAQESAPSSATTTSINAPSLAALLLHACGGPPPTSTASETPHVPGPMASVVSLLRSMSAPSASGSTERRPAAPRPPPPPANYDMDLEFD